MRSYIFLLKSAGPDANRNRVQGICHSFSELASQMMFISWQLTTIVSKQDKAALSAIALPFLSASKPDFAVLRLPYATTLGGHKLVLVHQNAGPNPELSCLRDIEYEVTWCHDLSQQIPLSIQSPAIEPFQREVTWNGACHLESWQLKQRSAPCCVYWSTYEAFQ